MTDARSDLFFSEFMDSYKENDPFRCREQSLSQLQCFIQVYTGDLNWNCRIDSPQNCQVAKPREILDHVWSHWPTTSVFTVEKKAEIARKVYFTLLNLRESQTRIASLFVCISSSQSPRCHMSLANKPLFLECHGDRGRRSKTIGTHARSAVYAAA
jgi:hypothetical protein